MSQVEYTAQDFELVGIKEDQTDVLSQKTTSFWGQVFHTFARNKLALFSVALLAVIALLAIFVIKQGPTIGHQMLPISSGLTTWDGMSSSVSGWVLASPSSSA